MNIYFRFLSEAGFILFLNKQDILEQKIREGKRLENFFPEFSRYHLDEKGKYLILTYLQQKLFIFHHNNIENLTLYLFQK